MPRSWSYRKIEHIDVTTPKPKGLPPAAWAIIIFAMTALAIYTTLAINIELHPVQVPVYQPGSSSSPPKTSN